jgi:hypothetical protein
VPVGVVDEMLFLNTVGVVDDALQVVVPVREEDRGAG